jgi:xanthine dehydrogenase accessory factor
MANLEEVAPTLAALRDAVAAKEPVALATLVELPDGYDLLRLGSKLCVRPGRPTLGSLGSSGLDRAVEQECLGALASGRSALRHFGLEGEARRDEVGVFVQVLVPPPHMVIFGAVDFTAALARVAKVLGYSVTICDARSVFATRARFPMADEVVVEWPDRYLDRIGPELGPRDAVCILTHDPKFDVPALRAALATDVGYIGAMGSRRTHAKRMERLLAEGADPSQFHRVMGPIGLDLGARSPEETAISIAAEIVALRNGVQVPSLRDAEGPIHHGSEARSSA